jgi:NAD/NADP transhydrogenase beta subunit
MDDLATKLDDRGDRVRFVIATADPVAGECLAHMGRPSGRR